MKVRGDSIFLFIRLCNEFIHHNSHSPDFLEGQQVKMPQGTFFKPKFFDFVKEEYLACIEGVGIIDMSSFSKIEIKVPPTGNL